MLNQKLLLSLQWYWLKLFLLAVSVICNDLFLQAAAHIHRYLNLDEQVLRDLAEDSKEGESSTIIAALLLLLLELFKSSYQLWNKQQQYYFP